EIIRLGMGEGQEILSVGRTQRLFTPAQRKLLLARDLGCCFIDCRAPATWCEAHHILPWQEGGETSIENGALLCSRHHGLIHHSDWTMKLITGTPYFTAPYLIDPSQTP
ncbi:HNH endonuclease, partial [Specibacter sp. AOP5-B1-6]|uniref:HNH endonuclease n=1 Tax=Specibacter sp. AOP5-B1-6 TaxID=3457653 RepID=UPI00402B56AC